MGSGLRAGWPKKSFNSIGYPASLSMRLRTPEPPKTRKGHGSPSPVALDCLRLPRATLLPVAFRASYVADTPGRPGSTRPIISPSDGIRDAFVMVSAVYRPALSQSRRGLAARPRAATLLIAAEDQRFDGLQMVDHRLPRGGLVAVANGAEQPTVVVVRALRSARRVERVLATLAQQIHHGVRDAGDRPIVRRGADRRVELRVLFEPGATGRDLLRLRFQDPLHLLHVLRRRAARGQ